MGNKLISGIAAVVLTVWGGGAMAQSSPSAGDILQAWLASPHADSTSEAFRHWDSEGEIPGTCAVCHSTTGLVDYLASPMETPGIIDHPVPLGTTVECAACHDAAAQSLTDVLFPSGVTISATGTSNVCRVCHQGRSSSDQVEAAVSGIDDDAVSAELGFINVHYSAAAATQLGGAVRGGYQYAGREYAGPFQHVAGLDNCVSCHGGHDTSVQIESCTTCHQGATEFESIRTTALDVLGRGESTAGISTVVDELHARLGAAIAAYSQEVIGTAVAYSDAAYPYFFIDTDGNGIAEPGEAIFPNRYQSWTPRLLRAAYNYQFVAKDHGAFAHNPHYVMQLMFDSLADLSQVATVDMTGLTRP